MSHTKLDNEKETHGTRASHASKDYKAVRQQLGVKVHSVVIEITGTTSGGKKVCVATVFKGGHKESAIMLIIHTEQHNL